MKIKIFGCALLKFLKNYERNDSYIVLVVLSESIEFIAHSEGGKVEVKEIYVSTK